MRLPSALTRLPLGLAARIGLACIGAITVAFIALCLVVLVEARRDATSEAETQARNIAASVAQDVGRNIDLYDLSLQAVVQGLQWPGIMALDPKLRQMILFERAARAPYLGFINALDAAGTVIADSANPVPRGGNFATRDYFKAQRNDARDILFIGLPFLMQAPQFATIPLSRRISNPDGSFAGVVVGSMRLAYFRDLFARLNPGPHGTIALLRSDGVILMRLPFNADDIGRTLPADAPFFRSIDGGQVDGIDPTDRMRRRFLFRRIGTLPLVVAVGLADADIYGAWRRRADLLGLVLAALSSMNFVLLLVIHYALIRREAGLAILRAGEAQRATLIEQREQAVAAMAQAAAGKARFVAAMSHELRTPLNSLLGYAELLALDGGLGPVQAARLAAMRSAGEHLREVVDQVLDFSRAEAEDQAAVVKRTDLAALLGQCRAIIARMAGAKGLNLACSMAPDLPQFIMADAAAIRQVLLNLLGNAVKFTEHGEIELLVMRCPAGIRFAITDTGLGVPDASRDKLFQPYERLDADQIGVSGTGLGLAITANLVARMGGRIGHDANPSGGSVFWVELPLQEAAAAPPAERAAAAPAATRTLRILVADDSAMNRDVAAAFLQHAGHVVVQAENGEAALRLATAEDFDVILMDLRMPGIDGMTAARQIRALPGRRGQTPVIAVTAQVMDDGGAALLAAGFQGLLLKPIERHSLLATVAAAADRFVAISVFASPPPAPDASTMPAADTTAALPGADADEIDEAHLAILSDHITRLLALLRDPAAAPAVADLAHRIAGDAGLLGYTELAMAARRYEASLGAHGTWRPEAAEMLRDIAETALEALSQERDCARRAAMISAKLP